jgi:hypothetical protein
MNDPLRKLRKAIKRLPGVERLHKVFIRRYLRHVHRQFETPAELFSHYYRNNSWGGDESRSGHGSSMQYTENVRAQLPGIWERYAVKTMLDAPCGDFNWMRSVQREGRVRYIGGDIVEELVARNQSLYTDASTEFRKIDVTADPLPSADLWMCRDCLFHFSDRDLYRALGNFLKSDIKYLLTSTHPNSRANFDIFTGDFRFLILEKPPFNFPKASFYFDDWIEGFPVRQMGLWSRETVAECLSRNRAYQQVMKAA